MAEKARTQLKGSAKASLKTEPARSVFEPRPFTTPSERVELPAQAAGRQDLLDSYLQRRRVAAPTMKENKIGLPDDLKTGIEGLSGYSMDDVKVHYNSSKPAQLKAHAFAQGSEIHIAYGQEKH